MSRIVPSLALSLLVVALSACGAGGASTQGPEAAPASSGVADLLRQAAEPPPPPPRCDTAAPPAPKAAPPTMVLQDGHTQMIMGLSLARDGRILASAGIDGIARVWDTHSGLLLRRLRTASSTFGLSLSADGRTLATYAPEGDGKTTLSVKIHDLDSGAPPLSITPGNFLFALTPDGSKLAIATAGIDLYDAKTGKKLGEARFGTTQVMAMSADGKRLAASASGELLVLELPSLKVLQRFSNPHYQGINDVAADLVLAGDSLWLRGIMGEVHRFDLATKTVKTTLPGKHVHMTLGKDRLWTIDSTAQAIAAWDLATGAPLGKAGAAGMDAKKLAASGDGSTVVLAASDPVKGHRMIVRDAASGTVLRTLEGATTAVATLAIDAARGQIATASQLGVVARWDGTTGRLLGRTPMELGAAHGLAYDASGTLLAAATGTPMARVFDAKSGALLRQWSAHQGGIRFAGFAPGSKVLLTAGLDGAVKRWDLSGAVAAPKTPPVRFAPLAPPAEQLLGEAPFAIKRAALSPSGALLAVLGTPGTKQGGWYAPTGVSDKLELALFEVASGKLRWRATIAQALRDMAYLAISSDDKSVLVSFDEKTAPHKFEAKLKVFEAGSGALRETRPLRYNAPLAFLGDKLAIGGKEPSIQSWPGPGTPKRVTVFDVEVSDIAVDPRKKRFVFGGTAGGASLLDSDGQVIATFVATSEGEFLTTTPDGAFVASLDGRRAAGWAFSSPLEGFSFDRFAERYQRPDVVAARLAGERGENLGALTRPPSLWLAKHAGPAPEALELQASVSSPRRVERVRVYVNARPVADHLVCAKERDVSVKVPLTPGKNRVTAVAYDADGSASTPVSIDVESAAKAEPPALWAVTVGVSRYPKLAAEHQLEYADDDARAIVSALQPFAGSGAPFAKLHATTLLDRQVTPDSVERALSGLAAMKPQDLAVVFLAGHGLRLEDGKMVFLTSTADLSSKGARAGGVGWERIEAVLRAARGRVILLLDACHSGHVSTELVAQNEDLAARLASDNRSGVLIFAASRGSQYSFEVPPPGGTKVASRGLELAWDGGPPRVAQIPVTGHGLFTSAMLEALSGKAVDRDKSGGIELGELIDYVTERVREASNGKQTPWVVRRELFGDFFVAPAR